MESTTCAAALGRRLREIRVEAGLSQVEVARRMGLTRPGSKSLVWKLEAGMVANPMVDTLGRFLRACGAGWSRLNTVLDRFELPAINLPPAQLARLPVPDRKRVEAATERQVTKYALNLPESFHQRAPTPERQQQVKQRFADYRVVANLVGAGILGVLRESDQPLAAYQFYRAVGRHLLGLLWRKAKTEQGRQALIAFRPGVPESIQRKLTEQESEWVDQKLDLELVAEIQATVLAWFHEIMKSSPELLPPVTAGRRMP